MPTWLGAGESETEEDWSHLTLQSDGGGEYVRGVQVGGVGSEVCTITSYFHTGVSAVRWTFGSRKLKDKKQLDR